jgi:hypothetical protein
MTTASDIYSLSFLGRCNYRLAPTNGGHCRNRPVRRFGSQSAPHREFFSEKLPHNHSKTVNIRLLIDLLLVSDHLRGHPLVRPLLAYALYVSSFGQKAQNHTI